MSAYAAHRAKQPRPDLDKHGPRVLCGANGCREVIAYVANRQQPGLVVVLPGLTDEGTPGEYRWSRHAQERAEGGRTPEYDRSATYVYSRAQWQTVGPLRFARVPCSIPCRRGHLNRIGTDVL